MSMPETAVNKNDEAVLRQHEIRATRQIAPMKPKPQTHPVGGTTDD